MSNVGLANDQCAAVWLLIGFIAPAYHKSFVKCMCVYVRVCVLVCERVIDADFQLISLHIGCSSPSDAGMFRTARAQRTFLPRLRADSCHNSKTCLCMGVERNLWFMTRDARKFCVPDAGMPVDKLRDWVQKCWFAFYTAERCVCLLYFGCAYNSHNGIIQLRAAYLGQRERAIACAFLCSKCAGIRVRMHIDTLPTYFHVAQRANAAFSPPKTCLASNRVCATHCSKREQRFLCGQWTCLGVSEYGVRVVSRPHFACEMYASPHAHAFCVCSRDCARTPTATRTLHLLNKYFYVFNLLKTGLWRCVPFNLLRPFACSGFWKNGRRMQ